MSNNNNKQLGEAPWLHVIISTGLGTGFVPKAPGTAGAFLALLIWMRRVCHKSVTHPFLFFAFSQIRNL